MARLKLRNRRSQDPLTKDGAAPDGTSPQAASAGGRWPGAEPAAAGTQPVPASSQRGRGPSGRPEAASAEPVAGAGQPAVVADADSTDAPFWERWVRVAEPSGLDDHGDGMPDDGPVDDA